MMKNKRGQITIFVIIAVLIIICLVALFFIFRTKIIPVNQNIKADIDGCIRNSLNDALEEVEPIGIESSKTLFYEKQDIIYMCYVEEENSLCTNIHPMIKKEIEEKIRKIISPDIEKCFSDLSKSVNKAGPTQIEVKIEPQKIEVVVKKNISYVLNEVDYKITNFQASINSGWYDIIMITNKILNEETTCNCGTETCNAEVIELNKNFNDFTITRFVTSANEKVYTIESDVIGNKFMFAIRNCVRMP